MSLKFTIVREDKKVISMSNPFEHNKRYRVLEIRFKNLLGSKLSQRKAKTS